MVTSTVTQIDPTVAGKKMLAVQIVDNVAVARSTNGDFTVYNLGIKVKSAQLISWKAKVGFDVAGTVTAYVINGVLRDVDNTVNTANIVAANFATNGTGTGKISSSISGPVGITEGPTTTVAVNDNDKQFALVTTLTAYAGTGNVTYNTATIDAIIAVDT